MHPSQVLEKQADLLAHLTHPEYANYLTLFVSEFVRRLDHRDGRSYPDLGENTGRAMAHTLQAAASAAYAYHVSADMVPLMVAAAAGLPMMCRMAQDDPPTQTGFAWLDEPIRVPDAENGDVLIRALMWFPSTANERPGVGVAYFASFADALPREIVRDWPELAGMSDVQLDQKLEKMLGELGSLMVAHFDFVHWGTPLGAWTDEPEPDPGGDGHPGRISLQGGINLSRVLLAYWLLLGQEIVRTEPAEVSRQQGKRARRAGVPDRVTVVRLRTIKRPKGDGHSDVEWSHRWIVRGHWRNQACGPGRAERRLIWVNPFIKGPEDAPLAKSERVYSLVR